MIKVYVKVNEDNEITEIASSIFLGDIEGWIEIDEGTGDRFSHAQSQYLEKGLTDAQGRYNYKLVDGGVVEILEEEKPTIELPTQTDVGLRVLAIEEELNALLGV